ncbi:transcriptional corepressor LEUNIG [Trifolium repens]|nr:transcriptional corepressor LEUNIG [Trifolium repens]
MNPIPTSEDLFRFFLYDCLKKTGFSNTAECFRNEAQITRQFPPDFDEHRHPQGLLYKLWSLFYDKYKSRQQTPGSSSQSQAATVVPMMDLSLQMIQDRYPIQHHSSFPSRHPCQTLYSCDFSSDGLIVACGGLGGKPFVCNVETNDSVTTSESHSFTIFEVRFQPGSTIFATSSADKTVKLWDAKTLERSVFDFVGHNRTVSSLDFHPLGGFLCSSDMDDVIKVWDLNRRIMINEFKAGGSQVRFQPGLGKLLAVANKNVINIISSKTFNLMKILQGHVKDICSICWDSSGQWIASASEDDVCVWSLMMDGQCLYQYSSKGKRFKSIIFHPRYRNVLVIGSLQCMELLIFEVGQVLNKRISDLPTTGLAACMQNGLIASTTTGNDSVVNIWK